MSSNGLINIAKNGKCRICYRTRKSFDKVKPVGEVKHGFAIGHIWQCIDTEECDNTAKQRISSGHKDAFLIDIALKQGRFKKYVYRS